MRATVDVCRVYRDPGRRSDYRVLVDRLWPRGISREDLDIDEWAKDLAPTKELRVWYSHESSRFEEFKSRYCIELNGDSCSSALNRLSQMARNGIHVTLLTATKPRNTEPTSKLDAI